ncbi:MAG TPA: hypothetical protein VG963_10760, partial [Polyangiaceae bacterium]|nr:hypothetical protein [Polyangiaceae bacterium]
MKSCHPRQSATLGMLILTTWSGLGLAQQPPGSNVPTPNPLPEQAPAVSTPVAPVLQEPEIEPKTVSSSIPNRPLLVTGVAVFGASYGASVIAAAVSDRKSDDKLYYPVAGPWMSLHARDCKAEHCANETLDTVLLVGSGVLQGVGALGIVMSFFIPETTTHHWNLIGDEKRENLAVIPIVGYGELGALATA